MEQRPRRTEEGYSGSDTIALWTRVGGHASILSSVPESSMGDSEGVGMLFQARITHLGVWGPILRQTLEHCGTVGL